MRKLNLKIQEDGSIEYYSIYSDSQGFLFFESPKGAISYMEKANDHFSGGVQFHKEIDGRSVLPSDLRGE